jgi:alkanesulfonate monooxygenase SsuD/methylene tetrahydromethanopterin reductase-like flavin-dependent oxidoreductase (luciferase family)
LNRTPKGCVIVSGAASNATAAWAAKLGMNMQSLIDARDRFYFGRRGHEQDQIGLLDRNTRAIFGRGYAAEPDVLIEQLREDEAIAAADTLLLTVPNQLGVAYNAHVLETILTTIAPALGWR